MVFPCSGTVGATIVYATLCLISLLFLTNFRLGEWMRGVSGKTEAAANGRTESAEETALERRARELEKQAKKLQEEVARSGLGADMQPVPEPTVRDLSVPQAKSASARIRKTTLPGGCQGTAAGRTRVRCRGRKPASAARSGRAATTEEILGKKSETEKSAETKTGGTGKS